MSKALLTFTDGTYLKYYRTIEAESIKELAELAEPVRLSMLMRSPLGFRLESVEYEGEVYSTMSDLVSSDEVAPSSITPEHIQKLLDEAPRQYHIFWEKELVVSYKLPNGFTVIGRSACVDPENFSMKIGLEVARDDAERQLWQLEGYLLQEKLSK